MTGLPLSLSCNGRVLSEIFSCLAASGIAEALTGGIRRVVRAAADSWARRWGATVSVLRGSSDGRRRRQIWSPRLAGVIGDGLGRRWRRSADLAGRWLAAAMVADVAATKLATTVADCGACCDAGPH
uniref:Uncharacterized protein n=1 Tax=Oryza nivara TaxID=4536 RepID=A0A0E0GDW5_ORYNI